MYIVKEIRRAVNFIHKNIYLMGAIYVRYGRLAQIAILPYNNKNISSDNLMLSEVMKKFPK
jgi:hypothetical protein